MSALLLPLICPRCGRDAQGSGPSKVFVCPPCRSARFMERPERAYPFGYLAAREADSDRLYAPFWRLEGHGTWRAESLAKTRTYGHAKPLGALYFPAFWTPRSGHDENLTIRYGLLEGALPEDPLAEAPVLPGILDPDHLPEMARLTWMAYLDRIADVTGVEVEFVPGAVTYVAVPFTARGGSWEDGVLGLRFPGAYFGKSRA